MKKKEELPVGYIEAIREAANLLNKCNSVAALSYIIDAIILNMNAPEPHNLLGILSEMKGDDSTARKHYRAAYALDPTFKPACNNLERLVYVEWGPTSRKFDYGVELQTDKEDKQPQAAISRSNRKSLGAMQHKGV